jgi:hypothetical protein
MAINTAYTTSDLLQLKCKQLKLCPFIDHVYLLGYGAV